MCIKSIWDKVRNLKHGSIMVSTHQKCWDIKNNKTIHIWLSKKDIHDWLFKQGKYSQFTVENGFRDLPYLSLIDMNGNDIFMGDVIRLAPKHQKQILLPNEWEGDEPYENPGKPFIAFTILAPITSTYKLVRLIDNPDPKRQRKFHDFYNFPFEQFDIELLGNFFETAEFLQYNPYNKNRPT